ncbi:MAG: response regulator [Humidesulfovibrio sp.]|nr:response regulator [Humidesulfovibrio sp.]
MFEATRQRPRILVADDESIIAMQIGELLEAEGFELAGVAGTASQAVDMARRLRPDLVLMDIVMPGGGAEENGGPADGIDACALIQRDLHIPVVLLSAHGEEHFLRRARRALPSAYLLKPCQNTQIRAAIEVALALRVHSDPAAPFRLREAHHRIKNSFSLLHSMLRFQEIQTADPVARHSLADAGARVLALSKAHEAMGNASPEALVDARVHVESLARTLFEAQAPPPPQAALSLDLRVEPVGLLSAQVVPCAIFLAEGLTNAIKHAFPGGRRGTIRVELRALDGQVELSVADDGVGFGGDPEELGRNSFGLQCLRAAAEQLEGTAVFGAEPGHGARVSVRFPLGGDYQSRSA